MNHKFKLKRQNCKILRRKHKSKSSLPGLGNGFLDMISKAQAAKEKNR